MTTGQLKLSYPFIGALDEMQRLITSIAKAKGFWPMLEHPALSELDNQTFRTAYNSSKIALMHSELSEALEAIRDGAPSGSGEPGSSKIPFTLLLEELADVVIRVLDFAGHYDLPLAEAILAKVDYNAGRPMLHGRKI